MSIFAHIPFPDTSLISDTLLRFKFLDNSLNAFAIGWFEKLSIFDINSRISSSFLLLNDTTFSILNEPFVKVPVLSNTKAEIFVNFSIYSLPLIYIPDFEALPIPAKNPKGIDITRAQGHEITRKVKALLNHKLKSPE